MKVCACQNIMFEEIVEAMREVGNNPDDIRKRTDAGRGCGECLESGCDDVDLPFPDALKAAETALKPA